SSAILAACSRCSGVVAPDIAVLMVVAASMILHGSSLAPSSAFWAWLRAASKSAGATVDEPASESSSDFLVVVVLSESLSAESSELHDPATNATTANRAMNGRRMGRRRMVVLGGFGVEMSLRRYRHRRSGARVAGFLLRWSLRYGPI